jgi:flagellin-like hook-associated protein FlgL
MAVALSNGIRSALSSLQGTSSAAQQIQYRLATGKKVNSAVDNAVNFFTSASLNDRASALSGLLDGISNATQTLNAASKGMDGITKLIQSAQSTIRQAQSDAAQNRPAIASTVDFGSVAEATLSGKSRRDVTLDKVLIGAAATATATTDGVVGLTAAGAGSTNSVQLSAGNTTYKFTIDSTSTMRDLVNGINQSGIATASVNDSGALTITGTGSSALTVEAGTTVTATGVFSAVAGDQTALFAAVDNTAVVATGNSTIRTNLVDQFNSLRTQIDELASDAGFNGINLLDGNTLSVVFNEKTGSNQSKLDIQGQTISAANLGLSTAVSGTAGAGEFNIQDDTSLSTMQDTLTAALGSLRSFSSTLGSNLAVVQTRQDFAKGMIDTLKTGADNLVLADPNEEGASLLALNTRTQLSQTALSLASQADQAVLRLF